MGASVELPSPLWEELSRDAELNHVSAAEHAEILLSVVRSLRKDHQETTSAKLFKTFLRSRSLDADLFVSAFEELVGLLLKNRCDTVSIDENYEVSRTDLPPIEEIVQKFGRVRRKTARGIAAHLNVSSEDVNREHQEDIAREEKGWY